MNVRMDPKSGTRTDRASSVDSDGFWMRFAERAGNLEASEASESRRIEGARLVEVCRG